MKIKISKSQWQEMGKKAGWIKTSTYEGDSCPKCGNPEHNILSPSHPIINECTKCKYQWNPDNEKYKGVSIFELVDDWGKEGYGIALVSPDNIIITPYIDPSDYPDMVLNKSGNGAKVISGKDKGCSIVFHSGSLEGNVGKDCTDIANPQSSRNIL